MEFFDMFFAGRPKLVVSTLLLVFVGVSTGQADESLEMGRMAASQMLGNYQQIKTWKGSVRIMDRVRVGPEIASRERLGDESGTCLFKSIADVEFAVDVMSDSLFCSYRRSVDGEFELSNDKRATAKGTKFSQDSIITPKGFIRSDPEIKETSLLRDRFASIVAGFHENRVAVKSEAESGEKFSDASMVFDPRKTFEFGGRRFWEFPKLYSEWIEKGTPIEFDRITEPVVGIRYTNSVANGTHVVTLDGGSGWLPVQLSASGSWGAMELSVEYQEDEGIFVPLSFHRLQTDADGIVSERRINFKSSTINEPIAERQFTLAGLGVGEGTRVKDEVGGGDLWLLGGDLVSSDKFVERVNAEARSRVQSSRYYLIYLNLIVVLLVACFFTWKKLRKFSSPSS